MNKIGQSGGFLGRLLRPLLKAGLPLMKNVLKPLAESASVPLRLTAAASATDAAMHKKWFGWGARPSDLAPCTTALIISKEEINDIIKIVESLEESGLLIKDVSKTSKNEAKKQKGGFLNTLLETLGARFLGNLLTVKRVMRTSEVKIRAGQNS